MKKLLVLLLLVSSLFGAAAWSAEVKIAVVNVPKLMKEAPQAETMGKALRDQFADREKALLAEQEEIKALEGKYANDKNKDFVSAKEREEMDKERDVMEKELREKVRDFQRKSNAFTEDVSTARNELLTKLQTEIYNAIVAVAEAEKYDLIVGEAVLYASEKVDVTDQVLKKLKAAQ